MIHHGRTEAGIGAQRPVRFEVRLVLRQVSRPVPFGAARGRRAGGACIAGDVHPCRRRSTGACGASAPAGVGGPCVPGGRVLPRQLPLVFQPAHAVRVVAHQHVGGHHRLLQLRLEWVRDRARHAARNRASPGSRVDRFPVGQAERHVAGAAHRVAAQARRGSSAGCRAPRGPRC